MCAHACGNTRHKWLITQLMVTNSTCGMPAQCYKPGMDVNGLRVGCSVVVRQVVRQITSVAAPTRKKCITHVRMGSASINSSKVELHFGLFSCYLSSRP